MENAKKTVIELIVARMEDLSPTNKKIGGYIIANKQDVGFASVANLSEKADVSKAALVRFAKALGFDGFNQLKHAVQEELKQQLSPYSNVLLNDLATLSEEKQLRKLAENEVTNISKTLNSIDISVIMDLVKHMGEATRIFVSGFGGNNSVAQKLAHSLKIITDKQIEQITGAISDFSPALSSLEEGDVVFLMTLPTYSQENFPLAEFVLKRKGYLCLLTDSPKCPLYKEADAVFLCERNSLTLANSYVSIMAITQVLTDMFFLYSKQEGIRSIQTIQKIEQKGINYK